VSALPPVSGPRVKMTAHRRKAIEPVGLPFGVVAMDGKVTALPSCDDRYAQHKTTEDGHLVGLLRTTTCTLVSSAAKVCVDAIPIPAATNEMGFLDRRAARGIACPRATPDRSPLRSLRSVSVVLRKKSPRAPMGSHLRVPARWDSSPSTGVHCQNARLFASMTDAKPGGCAKPPVGCGRW